VGLFVENRYFVVLLVQLGLVGFSIFSRVSRVSKFRAWIRVSIRTRASLVFSERARSLYAVAHLSVACLSSVTLVHPTQPVEIFRNISMAFGTLATH